jgi:hypothetical protein
MNARPFSRPRHSLFLLLAIRLLLTVGVPAAQAAVCTDQDDYAPGSVVTFFGDNEGLTEPWAYGAEVTVDIVGPNGISHYAPLTTHVGMDGSWSCQFTLSEDPVFAVGEYSYTASAVDPVTGLRYPESQEGLVHGRGLEAADCHVQGAYPAVACVR